jgi:tripartite-type tricarboxylate transporter receptor subunit TctC
MNPGKTNTKQEVMSQPTLSRRQFLKVLGVSGGTVFFNSLSSLCGQAAPRPCPNLAGRNIRWIVPYSSGGGYDTYSRLIAPFFGTKIDAKIIVENVSGSGGIVGAYKIAKATADGLTLGIVNASGLLTALLAGETRAPNLAKDFSILGRVARSRQVWVTAGNSPLKTIEDVLRDSRKRPIVFAISDVGGTGFLNVAVGCNMLDIRHEYVAGYPGSRESSLAVLRGEVDILSLPFESGLDRIEAEDLRPILQIDTERISPHPSLQGVALLGGKQGLAARRAAETGRDVEEAIADAAALTALIGAGRLIVAPLGLEESVLRCLEKGLYEALNDPAFYAAAAKAKRSLDVARGPTTRVDILAAVQKAEKFAPILRNAIKKARR